MLAGWCVCVLAHPANKHPEPRNLCISSDYLIAMFCEKQIHIYFLFEKYLTCTCARRDKRLRLLATSGCSTQGLFGLLRGDVATHILEVAFEAVSSGQKGVNFRSSAGKWRSTGGSRYIQDLRGHTPQLAVQRGDYCAHSCAAVLVRPRTCPKKKKGQGCSAMAAGVLSARRNFI